MATPSLMTTPRVDLYENNDEVLLIADLPGVVPEDLHLRLDRDTLHLEATPKNVDGDSGGDREWAALRYRRAIRFGLPLDAEKVRAELKDGVLHVHLPFAPGRAARRIPVVEA